MKRLSQFFSKHLRKYFQSSPRATHETDHRGEQVAEPDPPSELLDEPDDSSQLYETTDLNRESRLNEQCISPDSPNDNSTTNHLQVKEEKNETAGLAVSPVNGTHSIRKNKPIEISCGTHAESVQVLFPSANDPQVTETNCDVQTAIYSEIPVSAHAFVKSPNQEAGSALLTNKQSESIRTGQLNGMVSGSQHVPSPASHQVHHVPLNSTLLRKYLESTSARRSSPPYKTPIEHNERSSIAGGSAAARGPLQPTSESTVPKNEPEAAERAHVVYERNSDKNPETSSSLAENVSVVSMVEVSDSTKEVIGSAMRRFGMKPLTTEGYWNVRWSDHGVSIQTCQKFQKYQRINRFPGSGLLLTKNNLAKTTTKMRQTFPEDYSFVPETWCLSAEISKVEQYARAHDNECFIVKPNDGSSGAGIIITRSIGRLKMCDKMVCQVYIQRPFLIDGFKFDFRIYTLITSCRPLRLFVYSEGLARFATAKYEEPNQNNESNRFMHLTNYAVNKRSPMYIVDESKGTLRRLTTIHKWLLKHNIDADKIWETMDDVIIKTIITFLPSLRHNYRVSFPEQSDSNSCFQILGFDIMFDHNLKPYVLEVNDSPSFKADIPLDKQMTKELIYDTFNILHLNENNRNRVLIEDRRQSRKRLLSSSSQNRKALHKEKERTERLLTQSRMEWENTHMGNFRKVYPNDLKLKHYKKFIKASQDIFMGHS